jgi:hypothetical protein
MRMKRAGSAAPATYLDQLPTLPVAVWSLRKLISTATLSIRVRRSSDNAEQDIGFDGDVLDTTALASFVGANSAYVVTWYGQTGSYNFTNATAAQQPRIVNAGVYEASLGWNGSNLLSTGTVALGTPRVWVFADWAQATSASSKIMLELSADYTAGSDRFILYENSAQGGMICSMGLALNNRAKYFADIDGMALWSFVLDRSIATSDEIAAYVNGNVPISGTISGSTVDQSGTFGNHALHLGARSGVAVASTMRARSVVLYSSDVSSIRTSIEALIKPVSYSPWDVTSLPANCTASNGNFRITRSGGTDAFRPMRHPVQKASGKYALRFAMRRTANVNHYAVVGMEKRGVNSAWPGELSNSWGFWGGASTSSGNRTWRNSSQNLIAGGPWYSGTSDSEGMVELDIPNGRIYWGIDGVWLGTANPAAGTGHQYNGLTGPLILMLDMYNDSIVELKKPVDFITPATAGFTPGWPD